MKYEAICYSFSGKEIDHSPYMAMPEIGPWLSRAVRQLPGIERIEVLAVHENDDKT